MDPAMLTVVLAGPEVGLRVMEGAGVTVKVELAVAVPLAALTVAGPVAVDDGTAKLALNVPSEAAVTGVGAVVIAVPLKVMETVDATG